MLNAHYEVNVRATTLLCKEFLTCARAHKTGGNIVSMSSGQALGVMDGEVPYTLTKASVEMLTLQLAPLCKEVDVTINAIDPGPVDTGWVDNELREILLKESKRGKIYTPSESAELIVSFISGERIKENGMIFHAER